MNNDLLTRALVASVAVVVLCLVANTIYHMVTGR